jgi:tRNA A58 N-methylase Trm61
MLDSYEKIFQLKKFTDKIGLVYGTEDFAIYLYSIIKMSKAKTVLELGTGLGVTTMWAALGLEENTQGTIHTIDDGSEWESLKKIKDSLGSLYRENYQDYILNLISTFEFNNRISFYNQKINKLSYLDNIDIVFCDYSHGPYSIVKLLGDYLIKMNEVSYIFIDSASTYYPSFHTLESIVSILNQGKVPKTLYEMIDTAEINLFREKVAQSKFELTHLVENKQRNQNSTAQIKITPIDIMPQPRVNVRF